MMQLGMSLYHAPSLRMEQNCTECNQPLSQPDVGSTVEACVVVNCGMRKDPPHTTTKKCPKCGRCIEEVNEKPRKHRRKKGSPNKG